MSNAELTKREDTAPLPINGMNDMVLLGDFIAQSQMLGASSPAAGLVIAATCVQERMSLLEFGRRYHVDGRGKVTMRSDRMLAEFMALGGEVEWTQWDKIAAVGKWSFGKNQDKEIAFTYAEAEEAGYIKPGSNWEKDPAAQLRARCITRAVRMICPAAVAGVYAPEEMQDVYNAEQPAQAAAPVAVDLNAIPTQATPQTAVNMVPATLEADPTPFDEVDYTVCPAMNTTFDGQPWSAIPVDQLGLALKMTDPALTQNHKNEIQKVINNA